uniref:Uncharacterized protein n=1 Tax=Globodera rostochiensis TaxID=31243 RepID=A0A914I1R6_GLORO
MQTIHESADEILGSKPTQSSSSSSTAQPENQTSKTFDVYLSVTALSKKLMTLAFSANSEDPAQRDEQLQMLVDKLKQWTNELDNLSANCDNKTGQPVAAIPAQSVSKPPEQPGSASRTRLVSTIPDRLISAILAPTVQNELSGMPGRMIMQKLCTAEQSISRAAINIGTTANVRVVQAPQPATMASAPPRLRPAAFRISDGAGVCGIAVGRTGTGKVQQRRERLLVRRIPPSNAYLSAGSKLYHHQQQPQLQHQTSKVPPSNAYLSAGSKLAIRQQQMQQQQQRLKRLQHHLSGIGSSLSTAGGIISNTSATTASAFPSTSSSATAPIALSLRSAVVQQQPIGNIEQMQTEQQ